MFETLIIFAFPICILKDASSVSMPLYWPHREWRNAHELFHGFVPIFGHFVLHKVPNLSMHRAELFPRNGVHMRGSPVNIPPVSDIVLPAVLTRSLLRSIDSAVEPLPSAAESAAQCVPKAP